MISELLSSISTWLDIDNETVFTVVTTIFIFLSGELISHGKNIFFKWTENRKLRILFETNVNKFIDQVTQQSIEFDKVSKNVVFKSSINFEYKRVTISSIAVLNEIGYTKSYESYFSNVSMMNWNYKDSKIEHFNTIWHSLKQVDFWHDQAYSSFYDFLKEFNIYNTNRNVVLEAIRKKIDILFRAYHENGSNWSQEFIKYLNDIDKYYFEWQNMKDRNVPNNSHRYLVLRLRILNRKYKDIPYTAELNDLLLEESIIYSNLRNVLTVWSAQFLEYSNSFKKIKEDCENALGQIQS